MNFKKPLMQLPITFRADLLQAEIKMLGEGAWSAHPQGFAGNDAVPLVAPGGGLTDRISGPMAPTEHLLKLPYVMAVMGELGGVWGRSRLMRLAPGAEVPRHVDVHYYWRTHIRIHIPIYTNPDVTFTCGSEHVHMAAGESWIFDSFEVHDVQNRGSQDRLHLVLDTVGGDRMWQLIEEAQDGIVPPSERWTPDPSGIPPELRFEQFNLPRIMSTWEVQCHINYVAKAVVPGSSTEPVLKRMERFAAIWQAIWSQFEDSDDGVPAYRSAIEAAQNDISALNGNEILLVNEIPIAKALSALIFSNAISGRVGPKC